MDYYWHSAVQRSGRKGESDACPVVDEIICPNSRQVVRTSGESSEIPQCNSQQNYQRYSVLVVVWNADENAGRSADQAYG